MSQQNIGEKPGRIAPLEELINVLEIEPMAQRRLPPSTFALISGSDRSAFDRITFRPRMMVNSMNLDLSLNLFGEKLFAPILIGPVSDLKRFHPDGEIAMVRGAASAKTAMVVANQSSVPVDQIVQEAKTPLWLQFDLSANKDRAKDSSKTNAKAICLTAGPSIDWKAVDLWRKATTIPMLLKGVITVQEAQQAIQHGMQGVVVSNYQRGAASPIEALPAIADAIGGKAEILVDGNFRRGTDILKALAFGARAVLLGRPPVWGLAAYGADGVRHTLELLQSELARAMVMCGRPNLASIDRSVVRKHSR